MLVIELVQDLERFAEAYPDAEVKIVYQPSYPMEARATEAVQGKDGTVWIGRPGTT